MAETLLLPGSSTPAPRSRKLFWVRMFVLLVGFFVVLLGAYDVVRRASALVDEDILFTAFAPAIMLEQRP